MDVNSSAVLPPTNGIICLVDDDPSMLMSDMSGLEVQKELQVVSPKTRVIISTANDHDSVRNAAIQAGAVAYFIKPFDDDAFLAAVHQAMAAES